MTQLEILRDLHQRVRVVEGCCEGLLAQQREFIQRLDAQERRHAGERAAWTEERERFVRSLAALATQVRDGARRREAAWEALGRMVGRMNEGRRQEIER